MSPYIGTSLAAKQSEFTMFVPEVEQKAKPHPLSQHETV